MSLDSRLDSKYRFNNPGAALRQLSEGDRDLVESALGGPAGEALKKLIVAIVEGK